MVKVESNQDKKKRLEKGIGRRFRQQATSSIVDIARCAWARFPIQRSMGLDRVNISFEAA